MGRGGGKQVSNLVFYAQSTSTVISGRGKGGGGSEVGGRGGLPFWHGDGVGVAIFLG